MSIDRSSKRFRADGWTRIIAGILALSYGIGAPLTAVIEYRGQTLSQRFGYSSEFIYLVCLIQTICAVAILVRKFAPWSAFALTVITLGAVYSHLEIGSPQASVTAILYTAMQVWFGWQSWRVENG